MPSGDNNRRRDPTPEEIRQECERIQAGWSEVDRERRCLLLGSQPVEFDPVKVNTRDRKPSDG